MPSLVLEGQCEKDRRPHVRFESKQWDELFKAISSGQCITIRNFHFESEPTKGSLSSSTFLEHVLIENCDFAMAVDLSQSTFARSLRIEGCRFRRGMILRDVVVEGACCVLRSQFHAGPRRALDWRRLRVGGMLDMTMVSALGGIDLANARVGDDFRLDGMIIQALVTSEATLPPLSNVLLADQQHVKKEMMGKALNLEGASIERHVYVSVGGKRRPKLRGSLDLRAKVMGSVELTGFTVDVSGSGAKSAIQMQGAEIGGSVLMRNSCEITGAIDMERAEIGGSVFVRDSCKVTGAIDLRAKVTSNVELDGLTVDAGASNTLALTMESAEIGGTLFLGGGSLLVGRLDAFRVRAGCFLTKSELPDPQNERPTDASRRSVTITGPAWFEHARIAGPFYASHADFAGGLILAHAHVNGNLSLQGSALGGPTSDIAPCDDARRTKWIKSDIDRRFELGGLDTKNSVSLNLDLADISGDVRLRGATLHGSLEAENVVIKGNLEMTKTLVGGDLRLRSAMIEGKAFDYAKNNGNPKEDKGPFLHVEGIVDLCHSRLAQIDIRFGAHEVPRAVWLDHAETKSLSLSGKLPDCTKTSAHRLTFGDLSTDCDFGVDKARDELRWHEGPRVRLLGILIGIGVLEWFVGRQLLEGTVSQETTWIVLRAWVVTLVVTLVVILRRHRDHKWHDVVCYRGWADLALLATAGLVASNLILGLILLAVFAVYALVEVLGPRLPDAKEEMRAISFVEHSHFSRDFYLRVEAWLRQQGNEQTADHVFLLRRRRELRESPDPTPPDKRNRPGHKSPTPPRTSFRTLLMWFTDITVGYGVLPARPLHIFVLLWLLNWGVFANANSVVEAGAKPPIVAPDGKEPGPDVGGQPISDKRADRSPFFMAMRVQLPIIDLIAESDWKPSSKPIAALGGLKYENYAACMMFINWLLLPIMIAAGTGYLKRRG